MRFHGRVLFLAAVMTFSTNGAFAQNQHSNQSRGFEANGVYSTKAIDSINLFNGNLNLSVPIGGTYQVGSHLSYSFSLHYNSNLWNHKEICPVERSLDLYTVWVRRRCVGTQDGGVSCSINVEPLIIDPDDATPRGRAGGGCFTISEPNPMANAGMGWQLSLGKLFPPRPNTAGGNPMSTERAMMVYESPDGSEHAFYDRLHETETAGSTAFGYTRDNTYLRMKVVDATRREVHFPDGTIHVFEKQDPQPAAGESWRLVEMRDQFTNKVTVSYPNNYQWVISDTTGRVHTVNFANEAASQPHFLYQPVVKSMSLAGFGGVASIYRFNYEDRQITRGAPHVPDWDEQPSNIHVPFLTSIELPDTSSYKMPIGSYDLTGAESSAKMRGVITGIELPTGASIEWAYQGPTSETVNGELRQLWYGYPKTSSARAYSRASVGVRRRTVREDGATYVWKYDPYPEPAPGGTECVHGEFEPECSPKQFVNRVTDPEGNYTKSYFSVFPHPFLPGTGRDVSEWHIGDYSLPFTKYESGTDTTGKPVFLSVEYFKGNDLSETNPERRVFVRYENDKIPDSDGYGSAIETNRRVAATRTVYRDNEPNMKFSEVQYLDFDGLGHYRRVVKTGNFTADEGDGGAITEITNYNPARGRFEINPVTNAPSSYHTYTKFPETSPWVLNTYTETIVWEGKGDGEELSNAQLSKAAKKEFQFSDRGLLERVRTLKNTGGSGMAPGQSINDLLKVNEYGIDGTLTAEKSYGGDKNPISNGALSSLPVGGYTVERWVAHSYDQAKFLINSQFKTSTGGNVTDVPYVLERVVDANTGLVKTVTDASGINIAGLATHFTYDTLGRPTSISPDSGSSMVINYTPRTGAVERASATVSYMNNAGTATLKTENYDYDHMGRLRTVSKQIETGAFISKRTKYNGMGWKVSETEWGTSNLNSKETKYLQFDMFGRPTLIRPADSVAHPETPEADDFQHDISLVYRGEREIERTVKLGTSYNAQTGKVIEESATTSEYYDVHGRLRGVHEPSGTNGAQSFTGYEYDVSNRLRKVTSNGTQNLTSEITGPRVNVAREGQAIASSSVNANFPPASAINGDRKGLGWAQGSGGWNDGSQGDYSTDIVQVNFPGFKHINEIDIYTLRDNYTRTDELTLAETFSTTDNLGQGITHFEVQYWNGRDWVTIPNGIVNNNNKVWRQFQFPEVLAGAVRVQVYGSVKWASPNNYSRLVEIEAWGRATSDTIWVDDTVPAGATLHAEQDTWKWGSANPVPSSGALAHQSAVYADRHQHYFQGATQTLSVNPGEKLIADVYIDPANLPRQLMLQWNDGNWEHRAYWGENLLPMGTNGTNSRRYMGPLPAAGKWVRLEVPASLVGLDGRVVNGMAFTLFGGRATWDYAGKAAGTSRVNHARQSAGATAWASSQINANYPVSAVIDGERLGNNWGKGGYGSGWNDATQNDFSNDWLQVNFNGNKTIDEIDVFTLQTDLNNLQEPTLSMTFNTADNTGQGITDYEVQYLQEETNKWVTIPHSEGHVTGNNKVWRQFKFPAITTSAIRVLIHGSVKWTSINNNYSRIVEVEAYTAEQASFNASASSEVIMAESTTAVTQSRTFEYDNRGFLISESHPEMGGTTNGTVTYSGHDSLGNVGNKFDGVNRVRYTYDPVARRLTKVEGLIDDEPDDTTDDATAPQWRPLKDFFYYTNNDTSANGQGYGFGKLDSATRHNWHTNPYNRNFSDLQVTDNYRYKGIGGRISRRNTTFSSGPNFVQTYTYNDLGNMLTQTYPEYPSLPTTRQLTYTYANGLATKIASGSVNYATAITYHTNGMLSTLTHSNGVQDVYGQDPHRRQRVSSISTAGVANGYNLADGPYTYDGAGNITKIANNWYLYDKVQRLKEGTTVNGTWKKQYEYDTFGNIPKVTTTKPGQAPEVFPMGINTGKNRLGGNVQYDAAGNALGVSATSKIYRYDALNMIKNVPERVYFYDANDQRVAINENPGADTTQYVNTWMLRGLNNELLREYQSGANWSWSKDYIYFAGKLITSETAAGGRIEYHTDHLGTPRMITNTLAQQVALNNNFPFGEPTLQQLDENFFQALTRLKFAGHERDFPYPGGGAHTLDYMHARYYFTDAARFLSVDPGRDFDPKKPQSWNLYAYVRNNPINATDPDGRAVLLTEENRDFYVQDNWFDKMMFQSSFMVGGPMGVVGAADEGASALLRGFTILANRTKGKLFEARVLQALGLKAGETQVVIAMREFAAKYRVADGLTKAVVIEVKGVNKLRPTGQILDLIEFSQSSGRKLIIVIREDTKVSPIIERLENAGKLIIERASASSGK